MAGPLGQLKLSVLFPPFHLSNCPLLLSFCNWVKRLIVLDYHMPVRTPSVNFQGVYSLWQALLSSPGVTSCID